MDRSLPDPSMQQRQRLHHLSVVEERHGNVNRKEVLTQEEIHPQVLARRAERRRDRDASDEAGRAQERPQRQESHRSQTGHRDRSVEGAQGRQESPATEVIAELRSYRTEAGGPPLAI